MLESAYKNKGLVNRDFKLLIKLKENQRFSICIPFEAEPNRDLVFRDQKVLPGIRNRPLLPRDFSTIQPSQSLSYSSRGTSGFTHPTSVIHIRPG